jgi:hypothetical protein
MLNKAKLILIAAVAASSIALPAAALAQSAYATGTAASRAASAYPSPNGYGSGLYDHAPGHFTATPFRDSMPDISSASKILLASNWRTAVATLAEP